MALQFTKMHGLGNDFMVINGTKQTVHLNPGIIKQWADRHRGVGFDQLLIIEKPQSNDTDFFYRIYNSDGYEVEQCGNGARCIAKFITDENLSIKNNLTIATINGKIQLNIEDNGNITVDMGKPTFIPTEIPFTAEKQQPTYEIDLKEFPITATVLAIGNPHAVIQINDIARAPVDVIGAELANHPQFPNGVNVGFVQILDEKHIALRVYERGVGETLACGSGACAAVIAGRLQKLLAEKVDVNLPGGSLSVSWNGPDESVYLTGPTETVFKAELTLPIPS